jgi:hypothetical protein
MPSFHPVWYKPCTITIFLRAAEMWRYCHCQKNVILIKCCYQRSCQRFFQSTLRFGAIVLQWLLWCGDHLFYVIVAPKRFVFSISCTLCFALCFSTIINSPCHIVVHFMQWPNLSLGAPHFVVADVTLVDFSHCANDLVAIKKTLTLCFSYLLCYCISVSLFFCCMFETKSFGKQQTLLRICMII